MSVEYLGKVNNIVTVEKLKELTGVTQGTFDTGDITFLKFNYDGKELLVADRVMAKSITWKHLDEKGVVFGKPININGIKYKCRFLTGGNGNPDMQDNSEWKLLIVDLVPNSSDSNWSNMYTICNSFHYSYSDQLVYRGYSKVDGIASFTSTDTATIRGWRPVLEKMDDIEITGINSDLGEIHLFSGLKYAVANTYGTSFNLTEKFDGQVVRTLNNQVSGTEFTFNIENFDSLPYGNHTIEIIADDLTASGNVVVTSKFNKIKNPVQPMPTNSNLKQVMLHNKELEKEISYQNFRLGEKLKGGGIEVVGNESLSKLIDEIELESHKNTPRWLDFSNMWFDANEMSVNRSGATASVVGSNIYVFGGTYGVSSVECYNSSDNSWEVKSSIPIEMNFMTSSAIGGNIYIFGSLTSTNFYIYNTITDTWTLKTNALSKRNKLSSAMIDGKIYVIGGCGSNTNDVMKNNECYDPITDTFTLKTNMPTARSGLSSVAVGGKIYSISGYSNNPNHSYGMSYDNECYDPITDTWSTKTNIPKPYEYFGCSNNDDSIYCIGGAVRSNYQPTNQCYNIKTDSWSCKATYLTVSGNGVCQLNSCCINNTIYNIGGYALVGSSYKSSTYNKIYII